MNPVQTFISALLITCSVIMGFQVDRWWEQKRELSIQNSYLERLIDDLKTDEAQLNSRIEYFTNVRQSGLVAIDYLQNPSGDEKAKGESLAAFYMASQAWDFTPASTTFEELKSSGALSLIQNLELRTALAVYYQSLEDANYVWKTPNYYRRTIRSIIPPKAQKMLWEACHEMEDQGSNQSFSNTCSSSIDPEEVDSILKQVADSQEVERNLNFMMSNVDISLELFRSHRNLTEEVVAMLNESLATVNGTE